MTNKIFDSDYKIFAIFASFLLLLGWLGFFASLFGIFYGWLFATFLFGGLATVIYFTIKKKINVSRESAIVAAILAGIILFFSFFAEPTIFSGRDQGSISEAAIRLAQNRQLEFSTPTSVEFFKIYGPGRALNFPGFHYLENGNLITQFPLPYIAWLGIFFAIFGIKGLIIANAILFFIFLTSLYLLARMFLSLKWSALVLFLTITSFPFFWFFKFTLSENLTLMLFWTGALLLAIFLKNKNSFYFWPMLFAFGLLVFARIEGFFIFAIAAGILFFNSESRKFLLNNKIKKIALPTLFLATIAIINTFVNLPFFKEIGKAFLKNAPNIQPDLPFSQVWLIFQNYGILPLALSGFLGIIYFLKKKRWDKLIPFFLACPAFFYFINPHISSDHPWMLRRFVFATLPALIFYATLFLHSLYKKNKKITSYFLLAILFFLNAPAFAKYATFAENKNLLTETEKISAKFSARDLILVDRLASGDNWAMITGPMNFFYNKNAVYFFNPDDFAKLSISQFNKIYLITPDANVNFYKNSPIGNRLGGSENYSIITKKLSSGANSDALPEIKENKTTGKIFEIKK